MYATYFENLTGWEWFGLYLLTGVAADTTNIYITGRNDLSGTRTTQLAEGAYGISTPMQQWKPTVASGVCSALQLWPTGDGTNASSVWNGDIAGNGRYARQLVEAAEQYRDIRLTRSENFEDLDAQRQGEISAEDMTEAIDSVHARLNVSD